MILAKMNLKCNFGCLYCYENPIKPGDFEEIDMEKATETIKRLHSECKQDMVVVHGGEPTTYPIDMFEYLLKLSFELTGKSSIQTNGYNITDEMVPLFKKYKTNIGFSIDGPWPLNENRGIGSVKERKRQTRTVLNNMEKLRTEGIKTSVIVVIHKQNTTGIRIEILKQWVKELSINGVYGRLNICCSGNPKFDLSIEEAISVYDELFDFMLQEGIKGWSPFRDMINALNGSGEYVCVYKDCDPLCTTAAKTILKDGGVGVCLRIYQDGKMYRRDNKPSNIRSDLLNQTDCKGCEWWKYCKGGCSGLSTDFDWRNKDRYCEVYKYLFKRISDAKKTLETIENRPQKKEEPKKGDPSDSKVSPTGGDYTDGSKHWDGPLIHFDGYDHGDRG